MIILQQDTINLTGYSNLLSKYGKSDLKIARSLIDNDIKRLRSNMDRAYNASDKDNIRGIIQYLYSLASFVDDDGNMHIDWSNDKCTTKSNPISMECFGEYGVNSTDYILLEKSNLVKIDITDLSKIIAFEMMHRDLGYETMEIDEKLSDVGIQTICDANRMLDLINENDSDILRDVKIFRIGDCPYATQNGKQSWDYFGSAHSELNKAFSSGRYKDCVSQSINVAASIINKAIIEKFIADGIKFDICYVGEAGLMYMVDSSKNIKELLNNNYLDSIVIRSFGRKFELNLKVAVI